MRLLVVALLWPTTAASDTATVRVTASIVSWAEVWISADCAGLESNDPEAVAWADDVQLTVGDAWCRDGERWAAR